MPNKLPSFQKKSVGGLDEICNPLLPLLKIAKDSWKIPLLLLARTLLGKIRSYFSSTALSNFLVLLTPPRTLFLRTRSFKNWGILFVPTMWTKTICPLTTYVDFFPNSSRTNTIGKNKVLFFLRQHFQTFLSFKKTRTLFSRKRSF